MDPSDVGLKHSEVGLTRLAENHLEAAIRRLGELVEHEDARIALEASELVLRLARPHSAGVWSMPSWETPVGWDDDWEPRRPGKWWPGGWPGGGWPGWPGGGGWPGDFGGGRAG